MKNLYFIFFIIASLCLSFQSFATDYYWVGDSGNWSEFATHWATSSGGSVFHSVEPGPNDNVFFDANSFSIAGQVVTIDVMAYCKTMDWTGVTNNPDFSGFNQLELYGSIIFDPNMTSSYSGNMYFRSNDSGNIINFSTVPLSIGSVEFNGTGDWIFQSDMDLSMMGGGFTVTKGTVNTNGYTISVGSLDSWAMDNRTIILSNSIINIEWNLNLWNPSTLTLNAGTSTINLGSNWIDGMGFTFYDINFELAWPGEVQIQGSSTYHTIGLSNPNVYGVSFTPGEINTIYDINFGATCANRKTIKSQNDGETTTIKKLTGTVNEDYLNIRDITVVGGATFITNNGADLGNVVNWTINPSVPTDYYWVGGTGSWSDADHWATSSGGAYPSGGTCIPTNEDNVYFDANSFSSPGEIVTVDVPAICKSMDWTGATNNPDISLNWPGEFYIYGSLTFIPGMTISGWGEFNFMSNNSGNTIATGGNTFSATVYFDGVGDWTLTDAFNFNTLYFNKGHLITNDNTLNGSLFYSQSGENRQIDLGNSIINVNSAWSINDNSNMILNAGTSTINLNGYSFIGGDFTYNDLNIASGSNATIYNSNTFNIVTILSGNIILEEGQTQTLSDLIAAGTCGNIININSNTAGNTTNISKAAGTINIDYIALQDIAAIGGATFNANNSIDLGNNSGWNFTFLPSTDYYWIGGGGNWSDPSHWSLASGGAANPGACIPTQVDNVFFDSNSGLSFQTVTIDQIALCNDMDWTGATNGRMSGTNILNIYGSLTYNASMTIWHSGNLYFKSDNLGNTIDFAGKTVRGHTYFEGSGEWTLQNDITTLVSNNKSIYLNEGSLITNNYDITTYYFYSNTDKVRQLDLGNSLLTVQYWYCLNGTNLTITPGTSTIDVATTSYYGGDQSYHDVNINSTGNISIYGGNNFNDLNISSASSISFEGGKTQTFNTLTIPSGSDCNNYFNIGTNSTGVIAHLSMAAGTFNGDWLVITDLTAGGGGTFNATNSQGIGNVTGWNITSPAPVDLYWIGDGGDWNDPTHWSLSSGGASYGCIPTNEDNVFFDANSFTSSSQIVNINVEAYCKNLDWTGVTNNPELQGWSQININGSLTFVSNMTCTFSGVFNFTSHGIGNTITSAGHNLSGLNFSGSGDYTLMDNLILSWNGITFNNGTLNTNDFVIDITNGSFISNSSNIRTLNLSSSTIYAQTWDIQDNTNLILNAGTSEIYTTLNSWLFNGGDMTYNIVTILNPTWGGIELHGSNTFNVLNIESGAEVIFEAGTTQSTTDFQATGNMGSFIFIHTTIPTTQAFINQTSHEFCSDYMNIEDISVGPQTFYAGENSIDLGNNFGWTWSGVTAIDQYPAALCEDIQGSGTHGGINLTLLEATIDGGNAYTHIWYNDAGLTNPVILPTNVTVADGQIFYDEVDNGICTNVAEVIYTVISPTLSFNVTDVLLCNGDNTGAIDLTVTGATLPLTFNWSNSDTSEDISGVIAGSYTVTVTDANTCIATGGDVINQPAAISIDSESHTDITCHDDNDGTITITASGGTGALSYDIGAGPQGTGDFSSLTGGTYTVTVTDINACSATSTSITINNPNAVSIDSEAYTDITCHDDNDGTITITASGGTGTLSYDIGAVPQATGNFTNLSAGSYTVTVTDLNTCSQTSSSFTINNPSVISIDSETYTDITCHDDNDGTITITASGGTGTLSYDIGAGPQATGNFTNLSAGTYTVTVTDLNSCFAVSSAFTINNPSALSIVTESSTDPLCNSSSDGSVVIVATGGTGALSYDIGLGSQADGNFTGLPSGTYTVTITDVNTCTITSSTFVNNDPPAISIASESFTDVLCNGNNDGTITVAAIGGTGALNYDIGSGNQVTGHFTDLFAGAYTVTVSDVNSCSITSSTFNLTNPPAILISETHTDVTTCGGSDGSIDITASGGTGTLQYAWTGPESFSSSSDDISSLVAGSYNLVVQDLNSCTNSINVGISEIGAPTLSLDDQTNILCFGECDGNATVSASGGTGTYSFTWSNSDTGPFADELCAGTYTVTVVDDAVCSAILNVTISQPTELTASHVITDETCYNACDGTLTVTANGGTGALSYDIGDGSQMTGNFSALCDGNYTYTISDVNGCEYIDNATILPYDMSDTIIATNPLCNLDCNGIATLTASDGSGMYSYLWDNAQTTPTIAGLCDGWYFVTITDTNTGCTLVDSIKIIEPDPLSLTLTSTVDTGVGDGTATVSVTGGTPIYYYLWDDPGAQTTSTATGLTAGDYSVTVTDDNGCTADDIVTVILSVFVDDNIYETLIEFYPNPSHGLLNFNISDYPDDELSVIIYTINGKVVYDNQYEINNGKINNMIDLSNYSKGVYFIKVTSESVNITEKVIIK